MINDKLLRGTKKTQSKLHNQVDSLKKDLKRVEKKVEVAEKKFEVITTKQDSALA